MKYKLLFTKKAEKEFYRIERSYQKLIAVKLKSLAEDFQGTSNNIKKLKGKYEYFRLRVGQYRVIFNKEDDKLIITVIHIGHRKKIYEKL